jgi:2-phosphosulfolactate phosphatase
MTTWIDVAVLPSEVAEMPADCYVVIDTLRATTTIAALFAGGITDLVVTSRIELARELGASEGRLLFGEVHGLAPEGFDYGNSPVDARDANVSGRGAVLFTTNGTLSICQVASVGPTMTGSLANASAVAEAITSYDRVVLVCAGNAAGRRFSQEDFATAGMLSRAVLRRSPAAELGDAASIAMNVSSGYDDWLRVGLPQQTAASPKLIGGSEHARRTIELGFAADVQFAMQPDTAAVVPRVVAFGDGWARLEAS